MIRAAGLALFSALLGGAIALVARKRPGVLERTRTFAFAAAAGVVAFHLLPEVLPQQGLVALLWIGIGFALPWVLEASARTFGPGVLTARGFTGLRVAAEVGFAALVFHSVAEGLALVAALSQPRPQLDLEIALVAHHAPLTAAVVLPFLDLRGPRSAALRSLAVGVAGALGAAASGAFPGFKEGSFLLTATAVTAGALLHVVGDEIRTQTFTSPWERVADLAACGAGLLVAGLGAALQHRESAGPLVSFLHAFSGVAIACAPALLFGVVAGALVPLRSLVRWDSFLLALALFGPAPAALLGVLSVVVSLPLARGFPPPPETTGALPELLAEVRHRAPPLLALLVVAAGLEASTPLLPQGIVPLAMLAAALLLAARLDDAGAVAVAAVLVRKGFDPGIAMALVALGPLTRTASLRALAARARFRGVAALSILALFALGAGRLLSISGLLSRAKPAADGAFASLRDSLFAQVAATPLGAASAALLIGIALTTLWSAGVRGWFAPLRHSA